MVAVRPPRSLVVQYFASGFLAACVMLWLARSSGYSGSSRVSPSSGSSYEISPAVWQAADAPWLGPTSSFDPPKRRDDYKYSTNSYQEVYDKSWTEGGYPAQSCWGCRFGAEVVARLPFHSMLDAGTGNGHLVRLMRKHGKNAWGIELSEAALKQECLDLLEKGVVEAGVLTNLPYADNSFDLVFSADVLEHIHEDEADRVVSELVRVSRRHLFLSISLKPHTKVSADNDAEANRHTMLRPRSWWEAIFAKHGAEVNQPMLWAMQDKDDTSEEKSKRDCRQAGSPTQGGRFEVCIVEDTWLVGRREQANVRKDRCITTHNQELEPWFFSFRKKR